MTSLTPPSPTPPLWLHQAEQALAATVWPALEATCHATTQRVVQAMAQARLGEEHFYSVTGYGHDDLGRDAIDTIFAAALQAQAAIVRPQLVSGTHALTVALRAVTRPQQTLVCVTGDVYDTLEEVIGLRGNHPHSLLAQGVVYHAVSLIDEQAPPTQALKLVASLPTEQQALIRQADTLYIQRSRGYSLRPTLTPSQCQSLIADLKTHNPNAIIMVDNCYGEFIGHDEPTAYGADLMAGSLIKNPGGGIVPTGGYVAGRVDLVEAAALWLTCPGVGSHGGYMFDMTRTLAMGLYLAPNVVLNALKGMSLAAWALEHECGLAVSPRWNEPRGDIIQLLHLGNPKRMEHFCRLLQAHCPVNAHLSPIPSEAPGYESALLMAGGTFMDGSSVELSADGPLRPPYTLFLQGGLSYSHTRWVVSQLVALKSQWLVE